MDIGIDIGGSHISVGLVEKNKIIDKIETSINNTKNIKKFIENTIIKNINILLNKNNININNIFKIGISAPGTIIDKKIITNNVNLGINKFNIYKVLKKYYPETRIVVHNDGKCAGIAEKLYGKLKNYDDCLFICLGTGVGGAVFANGQLLESKKYSGYEIGHITIDKNGKTCNCGKKGCFDIYGSMKNLKNELIKELNLPKDSISYDILSKIEEQKNENVQNIIDEYIKNLSIGISDLINIFEPEIIILGGSFSYYKSILLKPLKECILNNNLLINKRNKIKIDIAKYYNDSGIIGAVNI